MSTPFTIDATNFNDISKREELRLAFSERANVCDFGYFRYYTTVQTDTTYRYRFQNGDGTSNDTMQNNEPAHGKGFNLQEYYFWYTQHSYISNSFLNYFCKTLASDYNGVDVLDGGDEVELQFGWGNLLEFCKYCGGTLYTSDTDYGFRRVVDIDSGGSPIFTRGSMQVGDYIGGWLAEDLVLAYENLTHTSHDHYQFDYDDSNNTLYQNITTTREDLSIINTGDDITINGEVFSAPCKASIQTGAVYIDGAFEKIEVIANAGGTATSWTEVNKLRLVSGSWQNQDLYFENASSTHTLDTVVTEPSISTGTGSITVGSIDLSITDSFDASVYNLNLDAYANITPSSVNFSLSYFDTTANGIDVDNSTIYSFRANFFGDNYAYNYYQESALNSPRPVYKSNSYCAHLDITEDEDIGTIAPAFVAIQTRSQSGTPNSSFWFGDTSFPPSSGAVTASVTGQSVVEYGFSDFVRSSVADSESEIYMGVAATWDFTNA